MKKILLGAVVIALMLAGCGGGTNGGGPTAATATAHVSGPQPDTDLFGNSRVTVRATGAGVSDSFTVTAGRYQITYLIDAGTDGCAFALILTPSKDGLIVQSTTATLPDAAEGAGNVTWGLGAGTYLLQEDETGVLNCARGFSAEITAQN